MRLIGNPSKLGRGLAINAKNPRSRNRSKEKMATTSANNARTTICLMRSTYMESVGPVAHAMHSVTNKIRDFLY